MDDALNEELGRTAIPNAVNEQLRLPWSDAPSNVELIDIQSRRYLGSKLRLLPFLHRIFSEACRGYGSFGDLFAGTGVVAHSVAGSGVPVIANDHLLSNAVSLECWLSPEGPDLRDSIGLITHLNAVEPDEDGYVAVEFGDRYFARAHAAKIGAIRDEIDRLALGRAERAVALTSLIYGMDRVARTVGHYDAFRRESSPGDRSRERPFCLGVPRVDRARHGANRVFSEDASALIDRIEVDLLYLDPPYNSRQYSDTYHVLETVVRNDKPGLVGIARKPRRRGPRSRFCGTGAAGALRDLVRRARCRWIAVSYNNMLDGDKRSNAIISPQEIVDALSSRGTTEVFRTPFRSFTSRREPIDGHEEVVYLCAVKSSP